MSTLYRLVYASKNLLKMSEADSTAEIERILAASRRNNAHVGVTGALMFNDGAFAQVLEGPQQGVEETFERIQRDARHGDVTVLECCPVSTRSFADWSMAFVGRSVRGRALWSGLAAESGFDLARLDGDAVFATLHGLVLEEEGTPITPGTSALVIPVPESEPRPLNAMQVREELSRLPAIGNAVVERDAEKTESARYGATAALAVLKAALANERSRTTELRGELDDLRLALAEGQAELDSLRVQRDRWQRRAKALAAALCEDVVELADADDLEEQTTIVKDGFSVGVAKHAAA